MVPRARYVATRYVGVTAAGGEGCREPDSSVSSLRTRRDAAGGLGVAVRSRAEPQLYPVLGATIHGGLRHPRDLARGLNPAARPEGWPWRR
jgi:hypothetical protein